MWGGHALEIHETTSVDKFFDLRNSWNEVLSRSRDDSAFLTWEHIAVSVKHLKKNQALKILYITKGNKIISIAPLSQSIYTFKDLFSYSVIQTLDYGVATDYTGLILTENPIESLRLFLTYLQRQNNWDYFYINDIPEESILMDLLINNGHALPKIEITQGEICPYITIPDSTENFLKGIKGHFKKNLRRSLRNIEKDHGKVELKAYCELGSLESTMQIFFDLHQKIWVARKKPGAFSSQKNRDMFMDRAKLFAENDWLALNFLTVNDIPVSASYSLKYKQRLCNCLNGFEPEYAAYSVGNLLHMKVIEKCIQNDFKEYDFMKGDEPYKFYWTNKYRRNSNLEFVSNRLTSKLIRLGIKARCTLSSL